MPEQRWTIGSVATQAGVTTETIRYYEREGLLPPPNRTHTRYRVYRPEILARLNFIRRARLLGLSLAEIKQILSMSEAGRAPCCQVREMLGKKLAGLDSTIAELTRFREQLRRFLTEIEQIPDQADTSRQVCALIELAPVALSPGHKDSQR